MGGALIVGQGTTPDDAIADYMQQVKEAQEIGLYPEAEPAEGPRPDGEVVASKGQYLAVGHVHS